MNRTTAISLSSVIPEKAKLLSGTHTLKPVIPEDAKPPKAVIPEEAQPPEPVIPEDAQPPKSVIPEEAKPLSGTGTGTHKPNTALNPAP